MAFPSGSGMLLEQRFNANNGPNTELTKVFVLNSLLWAAGAEIPKCGAIIEEAMKRRSVMLLVSG
jgi:hypothetical protein